MGLRARHIHREDTVVVLMGLVEFAGFCRTESLALSCVVICGFPFESKMEREEREGEREREREREGEREREREEREKNFIGVHSSV